MINIVPATREHFKALTGEPPAVTVQAVAALEADRVLGIAGYYPQGSGLVMFANLTDEIRAKPRAIVLGIRALMAKATTKRMAIHAIADEDVGASARMLEHMGFNHTGGRIYTWQP